jgi:hypothetical protein
MELRPNVLTVGEVGDDERLNGQAVRVLSRSIASFRLGSGDEMRIGLSRSSSMSCRGWLSGTGRTNNTAGMLRGPTVVRGRSTSKLYRRSIAIST